VGRAVLEINVVRGRPVTAIRYQRSDESVKTVTRSATTLRYITFFSGVVALSWLLPIVAISQLSGYRFDIDLGRNMVPVIRCTSDYLHFDFVPFHSAQVFTIQDGYKDGHSAVWRYEAYRGGHRMSVRLNWVIPFLATLFVCSVFCCRHSYMRLAVAPLHRDQE
jgi:hypothetical protein